MSPRLPRYVSVKDHGGRVEVTFPLSSLVVEITRDGDQLRCRTGDIGLDVATGELDVVKRVGLTGFVATLDWAWRPARGGRETITARGVMGGTAQLPDHDITVVGRLGRIDLLHAGQVIFVERASGRLLEIRRVDAPVAMAIIGLYLDEMIGPKRSAIGQLSAMSLGHFSFEISLLSSSVVAPLQSFQKRMQRKARQRRSYRAAPRG